MTATVKNTMKWHYTKTIVTVTFRRNNMPIRSEFHNTGQLLINNQLFFKLHTMPFQGCHFPRLYNSYLSCSVSGYCVIHSFIDPFRKLKLEL